MTLSLHTIHPTTEYRKRRKRVGRGNASGHGTTSGRGTKGQRARGGGRSHLRTRALRQTLITRLPKKRGFQSSIPRMEIVNLRSLGMFPEGALITPELLRGKGLVHGTGRGVKILGIGSVKTKWTVRGCAISASAKSAIEAAGGTVMTSAGKSL